MTEGQVVDNPRSKRMYILWGIALGLLLVLGLVCWLVVVPFLQTRALIQNHGHDITRGLYNKDGPEVIRRLGGRHQALRRLLSYLDWPDQVAPEKQVAVHLLRLCGEEGCSALEAIVLDEKRNDDLRVEAWRALTSGYDDRRWPLLFGWPEGERLVELLERVRVYRRSHPLPIDDEAKPDHGRWPAEQREQGEVREAK